VGDGEGVEAEAHGGRGPEARGVLQDPHPGQREVAGGPSPGKGAPDWGTDGPNVRTGSALGVGAGRWRLCVLGMAGATFLRLMVGS